MSILKKEYELSVWNEELIDGIKKESRGTTIGASGMTHLGRTTTPKLVRSVKGTNTLTFQMPTKYFDSEKGDYVKNELLEDLYNERKLKLHYDGNWYEFYVKSIQEDKQFKSIMKTITCTDSFIDELSRTGYEVEFSSDLNNSVEELGTFMETEDNEKIKGSSKAILDGSVWDYRPDMNVGDFTEFNEQRFYKIPLSQFGGTIKGYKINLEVDESDFKTVTEKEEKEKRAYLRNPFTKEKRPLEYGDDQARVEELFYDQYEKDNGRGLLSNDNLVEISGDYIYVPITDLTYIMGSVYKSASASLEEPAIYGVYNPKATKEIYALQPVSENPRDLIQFLFFNENDEVLIDEEGVVANKNCHYLITIEQWNEALKKQLKDNSEGLIHWTSPVQKDTETYTLNKLYTTAETTKDNEKIIYTTKVFPNTRTIDNFNWYPVYYEGYLDKINDEEVSKARKISITDRTELNLNSDVYTTVYNQKDIDFKDLYSEDELNELINRREELREKQNNKTITSDERIELAAIDNDFRVCSKLNTRLILPSLARNLIENGTEITDTNGWEAKTQNINHDIFDTGSYRKMLEINVQQTVKKKNNENNLTLSETDLTGGTTDEGVSDYYLELLSPCLAKGDDLSVNGTTFTDYAINFGMIGQEKQIEKGKTYAIRLTTGSWRTIDYNFVLRATGETLKNGDTPISYDDVAATAYKNVFTEYKNKINALKDNVTFKSICSNKDKDTQEIIKHPTAASDQKESINKKLYKLLVSILDEEHEGQPYEKLSNIARLATPDEVSNNDYGNSDLVYVKYLYLSEVGLLDNLSNLSSSFYYATYLSNSIVKDWQDSNILKNAVFEKKNNVDLDKIVIGEGSTNLQGNYVLDGVDNTSDKANYIKFSDVADIADTGLVFLPNDTLPPKTKASTYLTNPLYYKRKKDDSGVELSSRWSWAGANNSEEDKDYYSVEDNAFLLFKAKKTIKNPYVAIKLESGPAQIQFDKIEETTYTKNSGIGVKICAGATDAETELIEVLTDNFGYLANKSIKIYQIDKNHFSDDFLKSVHFNEDDGTISLKDTDGSSFAKMTDKSFKDDNVTPTWQAQTSTGAPVYFTRLRIKEKNSKKTFGYALFIDDVYYGVFWLEKKS